MAEADDLRRENETLRERLSGLSEASLRINRSLDFDTVLQETVDSARALIGSRYGGMVVFDETGELQSFVTSGFDAEEHQRLIDLPDRFELFKHFSWLSEPLRVREFNGLIRSLGFTGLRLPIGVDDEFAFLAAPIMHRDESIGNIYLTHKEGGEEFSEADENTLVMFASQAALVIANAGRHREEQRSRVGLETLIDTSPVGVVVLDATMGTPVLSNREAMRILESLHTPDRPPEHLLEILTIVRADGREVSLEELTVAQVLNTGETVRAEEVVFQVPDGRSVTALINATPIRSEDGEIETFVVTMQDLSAVEELERMRAEFLAMVSHELRTPLTSIKGSASTLLEQAASLHPAEMRQFFRIIVEQADRMRGLISDLLDVARIETGALPVDPTPVDLAGLVDEARSTFQSGGGRNDIQINLAPELPLIMADRHRIVQVLGNLLSNASRNSDEGSPIRISVVREDLHVAVSVTDSGRGVPAEQLPYLFRKFFRVEGEDQGGDTGLGLAICKGIVEAHGGRIWAESDGPGLGSRFTFTIPIVAADNDVVIVQAQPPARLRRAEGEPQRILAVDDDPQALRYIRNTLAGAGYEPVVTGDPEEVFRLMRTTDPHLVLLDLMLPGTDGFALMQDILRTYEVPVIFLSAYGQEHNVARAFDLGAADYVVKPFAPTELDARIRAALRKREYGQFGLAEPYILGDLTINYAEREVEVEDRPVELTPIEYRLLYELSINAGRVLTHEFLLNRVWGQKWERDSQPVRSFVKKLRRKLGDDARNPRYIFSQPRVGYRMPRAERPPG